MSQKSSYTTTKVRALMAGIFCLITLLWVSIDGLSTSVSSQTRRITSPPKYSQFPHDAKAHQIQCSTCHKFPSSNWNKVRTGPSAFPDITDYPKHESCVGCHKQQFFRGTPPMICTICHTNPGPRDSSRHPYPNPREIFDQSAKGKTATSDFQIYFPHDKHVEIVSTLGRSQSPFRKVLFRESPGAEESCGVCHTTLNAQGKSDDEYATKPPSNLGEGFWIKKGTFKSVPTGHTTCFTCHSTDTGIAPAPTDCATCHKLKSALPPADFDATAATTMRVTDRITLDAWRRRDSSGKFRHEFQSHADLSCDTCHNVQKINTLDPKTKRVSIASCSMCHVTATVDDGGILNFEMQSRKSDPRFECTKCHIIFGRQAAPQSHVQAIVDAGGKP